MSDTHNKLQWRNNYYHWQMLDLVLDLNYLSISNPNPTHLSKHQTLTPNDQFSQRIWNVEYYSVHAYMVWSHKFRKSEISLDTGPSSNKSTPTPLLFSKFVKTPAGVDSDIPAPAHLCWTPNIEMVRSKIFQARTAHSPQHPAHIRLWTEDIYSFSNRPARGPLNNWQSPLILAPEAKYLSWLFCLPRQNICWDYFAFCGTWLVEVVMWCDNHNIQSYMLWLVWA